MSSVIEAHHPPAHVPKSLCCLLISGFLHQLLLLTVSETLPRHSLHLRGAGKVEWCLSPLQRALKEEVRGKVEEWLSQERDLDVPAQSGPHDARGESVDCDACPLQLTGEFQSKQQVGDLALTVAEGFAVASFTVQVIKVYVAVFVQLRGNHDDAAGSRRLQEVQQEVSEEEVAQMIHTKLHLKAILCLCVGTLVQACVVDEYVNL